MKQYYLGIDNGGTISKAALYDVEGNELVLHHMPARIYTTKDGYVERDLLELRASLIECIRAVVEKSYKEFDISPAQIVGLSTSCHGKGLYMIGHDGNPSYNGIISSDSRAKELVKKFHDDGTSKKIYPQSFQQLWTGHPASLLAWFSTYKPEVLERTKYICMGHDYMRYILTGEISAEISNMSGSALVDVRTQHYSDELLSTLGLSHIKEKLPPLVASSEMSGTITESIAQECGLNKGTPVYAGFFDVVAAAISSGLVDKRSINAIMGTWSISTCINDSISDSDYPYIWGNYCMPDTYFVHEGSPTSASNLAWFVKEYFAGTEKVYEQCNAWVKESAENEILFFPFLYASNIGEYTPSTFFGLRSYHSKIDMLRSIYEGIVFAHKTHLDRLLALVPNLAHISLVGGPSKSNVWMQMFSDIMEQEIVIPNCNEAGCKGVALATMVGSGAYSSFEEATAHTVNVREKFSPNQSTQKYYAEKFEKYTQVASLLSRL